MAAKVQPLSTIIASRRFISRGEGVVLVVAKRSSPTRFSTVLSSPASCPAIRAASYSSVATVVLPLVPVTPTRVRRRDGLPYHSEAI